MKKTIPLLITLFLLLPSCQHRSPLLVKRHRILMGTLVEISVIGRDAAKVGASIDDAFDEMERIEGLMSRRIPGSDISLINRWAGIKPVSVSAEVVKVIGRANEISKACGGYFDISIGALVDLWGFEGNGGHLPSEDEVGQALQSIGYGAIRVDEMASTVELRRKGMRIDVGGIAKGYAVDRAFEVLELRGYRNMIVNAGGDMRVGGRKIKGPWVIGIQDPRDRSRILATFEGGDISVATSGDYERYFIKEGRHYHHLLNPFTGFPAHQCRGVTILAKDALSADALATAVFVMGPQKGLHLIETMEGVEGLIVSSGGEIIISGGLKGKLRFSEPAQGDPAVHRSVQDELPDGALARPGKRGTLLKNDTFGPRIWRTLVQNVLNTSLKLWGLPPNLAPSNLVRPTCFNPKTPHKSRL